MYVSLIVAMSENNVIGQDNGMPWNLPNDLKRFKEITTGGVVIMGRKTYESIGRPLPNRENVVISRTLKQGDLGPKVFVVGSLAEALQYVETLLLGNLDNPHDVTKAQVGLGSVLGELDPEKVFIIGGGEIYKEALPTVSKMYLTIIHGDVEGDVKFPEFDINLWQIEEDSTVSHEADDKHSHDYTFSTIVSIYR